MERGDSIHASDDVKVRLYDGRDVILQVHLEGVSISSGATRHSVRGLVSYTWDVDHLEPVS